MRPIKPEITERTIVNLVRITIAVSLIFGLLMWYVYPELLVNLGALSASLGALCVIPIIPPLFGIRFFTKYGAGACLIGGSAALAITGFVVKHPLGIYSGSWGLTIGLVLFVLVSALTKNHRVEPAICAKYKEALAQRIP